MSSTPADSLEATVHELLREEPAFWEEFLADEVYAPLREQHPSLRYGHFFDLISRISELQDRLFEYLLEDSLVPFSGDDSDEDLWGDFGYALMDIRGALDILCTPGGRNLRNDPKLMNKLSALQDIVIHWDTLRSHYFFKDFDYQDDLDDMSISLEYVASEYIPLRELASVLAEIQEKGVPFDTKWLAIYQEYGKDTFLDLEELQLVAQAEDAHVRSETVKLLNPQQYAQLRDTAIDRYEKAGKIQEAVELACESGDTKKAVQVLEKGKFYLDAIELAEEDGLTSEVGRLYRKAIDYDVQNGNLDSAINLARRAGFTEEEMDLLEKKGDIRPAIALATSLGKVDHVIDLQLQVGNSNEALRTALASRMYERAIDIYMTSMLPSFAPDPKVFRGCLTDTMPQLIEERRIPASMAYVWQMRMKGPEGDKWLWNRTIFTGDGALYDGQGNVKVQLDAPLLRGVNENSPLYNPPYSHYQHLSHFSSLKLRFSQWEEASGKEVLYLSKSMIDAIHGKGFVLERSGRYVPENEEVEEFWEFTSRGWVDVREMACEIGQTNNAMTVMKIYFAERTDCVHPIMYSWVAGGIFRGSDIYSNAAGTGNIGIPLSSPSSANDTKVFGIRQNKHIKYDSSPLSIEALSEKMHQYFQCIDSATEIKTKDIHRVLAQRYA